MFGTPPGGPMTAEPLCRRWHLSLRSPGRSRPDAIIAEALCRRWHLPLRNPAAAPPAQSPILTDPLLLWLPAPSLGVTRWLDTPRCVERQPHPGGDDRGHVRFPLELLWLLRVKATAGVVHVQNPNT
jgi:hypothetical protein